MRKSILLSIALATAILCACGKQETQVDRSFPSQISQTGSTELIVDPYETSYASEHPKIVKQIDGYDVNGALVEQQINTATSDIAAGLVGVDDISTGEFYTIGSDGKRSKTSLWAYSYDTSGHMTQKKLINYEKDGGTVQSDSESAEQAYTIDYTYNANGDRETEITKVTNSHGTKIQKSITTYYYDENSVCTGYTVFNGADNITQKTKYVNNTNGKPVKEKTYSLDGGLVQIVINSYNKDGTVSFTETQTGYGVPKTRKDYFYDEQGYLIKMVTYKAQDGKLQKDRAYLYAY